MKYSDRAFFHIPNYPLNVRAAEAQPIVDLVAQLNQFAAGSPGAVLAHIADERRIAEDPPQCST